MDQLNYPFVDVRADLSVFGFWLSQLLQWMFGRYSFMHFLEKFCGKIPWNCY